MTRLNVISRLVLLALPLVIFTKGMDAQQLPQISQYMDNDYVINPASAGMDDYFEVNSMNRYQWTGIEDAPRTFTLSLKAPFRNPNVAMGGYLVVDNVGPTRRTGVQASYTYHFNLNEKLRLGLAASAGATQFSIDGTRITLATEGDPALWSQQMSGVYFDAKFGAMLHGEGFYVGLTLPQLMQNRVELYESVAKDIARLEDHYMLTGGYDFLVGSDFKITPSFLVKYVNPAPIKIDASCRVTYQNMVWIGGSFRNNDAWVAMAGYEWEEMVSIGYAYDFTTSNLRNYSGGTHEVVLGLRFNQ